MKVRMAVLSVSLIGVAACASSGGTTSYNAPAKHKQTNLDDDELYMARVEAMARRRGIDVQWINPPRKAVARQE